MWWVEPKLIQKQKWNKNRHRNKQGTKCTRNKSKKRIFFLNHLYCLFSLRLIGSAMLEAFFNWLLSHYRNTWNTTLCVWVFCIYFARITITQTHTIQETHMHKKVTGRVEIKKLLSRRRQPEYSKPETNFVNLQKGLIYGSL